MQSSEQILSIWTDWKNYHAPKGLIENDHTMGLLADYIAKKHGGVVSRTSLDAAVAALGNQVLVPEPSSVQKAIETAAKGDKKMRDDFFKSIKPQTSIAKVAQEKNAADKELKVFTDEIAREINSHAVYRFNRPDYSATESQQNALRDIAAKYDTTTVDGAKRALDAVLAAKSKLNR